MTREKKLENSFIFKLYLKIFQWLAEKRLNANDLDPIVMHTHILTVISTGILMWGYALVAYFYMSSPIPGIVGLICSLIHLLSPLLFCISNNKYLISGVLLGAGVTHQATFSFFSGGFESDIIIWFGIIPMLAGLIAGRYAVIFWAGVVLTISLSYLYLEISPIYSFTNMISPKGELVAHGMIAFGWIFLSLITVYFYLLIRDLTTERLEHSSSKIRTLLRVLCHDLANLLQVVVQYSKIAKKTEDAKILNKSLDKIEKASTAMVDVIKNINQVYAIHSNEDELNLSAVPLKESLNYICSLLEDKLLSKQIEIVEDIPESLSVLALDTNFKYEVLQNILTNAIKFSHAVSQIFISAHVVDEKEMVEITIQDHGVGMPAELKNHIFDSEVVATRRGTNGEKGTGFGMGIMKSYVEKFGGSVAVASEEGKGTTFIIRLRLA